MALRPDLAIIADAVPSSARVLDVGCGDGELMEALHEKGVDARGLEIDPANPGLIVTEPGVGYRLLI